MQAFECGFYSMSALYEVYQLVRQHLSRAKATTPDDADEEMDAVGEGLHFTRYALVLPFAIVPLLRFPGFFPQTYSIISFSPE